MGRKVLIFLFGLLLVSPVAHATDFKDVLSTPAIKSPLAVKSLLNAINLVGDRLVAVGRRGHILYSDDEGRNWEQAEVPVSSDLVAINFPTPQKGWAVGHDGVVLHSSDAGATWVKQFDGCTAAQVAANYYLGGSDCSKCHDDNHKKYQAQTDNADAAIAQESHSASDIPPELMFSVQRLVEEGPDKPFLDVWFEDESTGYIVGVFNLIFRTTNGGKIWKPIFDRTENPKELHLTAIRRIGDDLYISGEQGMVLKYNPDKDKFLALETPYEGTFFGLTGNADVLIAYGLRGNVYVSRDKGASWEKSESGIEASLTGAMVMKDGRIVMVSTLGDIIISSDNASSYKLIDSAQPMLTAGVAECGDGQLALVGTQGVKLQTLK